MEYLENRVTDNTDTIKHPAIAIKCKEINENMELFYFQFRRILNDFENSLDMDCVINNTIRLLVFKKGTDLDSIMIYLQGFPSAEKKQL